MFNQTWADYFDTIENRLNVLEKCLRAICAELQEMQIKEDQEDEKQSKFLDDVFDEIELEEF